MNWYLKVMRNYATFSGRARRKEYWMFFLFQMLFTIVAAVLDTMLGMTIGGSPYGFLYFAYALATLVPGLAVMVRRLHDTDRSGWWILITLIPIVGAIWFFVLLLLDSTPGNNKYGPNPKEQADFSNEALDSHLTN